MRIAGGETCRDMLLRCSTAIAGGDVLPFLIEDDLAVVAFIEFEKTTLRAASIQAIKTEGMDISTFLVDDADIVVHYFRFDAGQEAGPVFTHPYPHVHYSQAAGPRYSLNGWQSDNAIIEFFEHIYLTCYHETWLDWARAVWRGHCNTTLRRDPERRFDEIVSAFRDSQYEAIKRLAQ